MLSINKLESDVTSTIGHGLPIIHVDRFTFPSFMIIILSLLGSQDNMFVREIQQEKHVELKSLKRQP